MAIIGIDLGTTNSACGYWKDTEVELIPNRFGEFLTPSVVGIDENGELIVGKYAKARRLISPASCTATFKRYMGSQHKVKLGAQTYSAVELSAMVLRCIKEDAETYLGSKVDEAIISVPAYFNDVQRKATKAAAELVGLKVDRLINEPTAAALAYGLNEKPEDAQFVVLDLGGGTFDVSIMEYFDGVLEVHASAGDNFLGGEDFLEILVQLYMKKLEREKDNLSRQQLRQLYATLEEAKCALSDDPAVQIVGFLQRDDPEIHITRDEFAYECRVLLGKIQAPIERTLRDAEISPDELTEVILVGGATRMQIFRSMIAKLFQRMPAIHLDPDLIIARGTAIQAGLKEKNQALDDVVLTDVCPYSLGTGINNDNDDRGELGSLFDPIIERNCTVPISIVKRYYTMENNQKKLIVDIFQGESRLTKNNVKLGEIEVRVPAASAGEESIDVRFSYDMNGLLEVDVIVNSQQTNSKLSIKNSAFELSEKDLAISSERLAKLKFHPREQEVNKELLARAERLYESSLGGRRDEISHIVKRFERELESQIPKRIEAAQQVFSQDIESLESESVF